MDLVATSKHLSYLLRHNPGTAGLTLDPAGWVDVPDLLAALERAGTPLTRAELDRVVAENDKARFDLDGTGQKIRASQGHSVPVDLGYRPQTPPTVLYHGTPAANVHSILAHGLRPERRHAVHLSADTQTAHAVGARRGRCVVLVVDAAALVATGAMFTRSANGVWLVDAVPAAYLRQLR
jgi:putative RNA 2'-phosphotransferase